MENQENLAPVGPSLEYVDIINATRILEAAVARNAFSVKELAEFAPIIARLQDFSEQMLAAQNQTEQTNETGE